MTGKLVRTWVQKLQEADTVDKEGYIIHSLTNEYSVTVSLHGSNISLAKSATALHVLLSFPTYQIRPITALKPEVVIYIHGHLPLALSFLFFEYNNARLLHAESILTLFPISCAAE